MKKLAFYTFGLLALSNMLGAWVIPKSRNNEKPVNLDMVGGIPTVVNQSTVAVGANNTAGWVLSLWLSSGPTNAFVVLRDSATANTTSGLFLAPFQFASVPQLIEFDNPPRFTSGLSVNIDTFTVGAAVVTLAEGDTYRYLIPKSDNNIPALDSALVGMSVRNIDETTTADFVATGPVLLYGFHRSTGATTNYAEFRDTGTANTTSSLILPRIAFQTTMTYAQENSFYSLKYPVRFVNGMSVNTGEAANRLGVFYRRSLQRR